MINWIQLLTDNNIYFVTAGKNTGRNEVSVQCPWCGGSDPSQHMGIHLLDEKWGCWRDKTHRGTSSRRLISALLGVSWAQAGLIAQAYSGGAPADEFDALASPLTTEKAALKPVNWPPEFEPIGKGKYRDYLLSRGFDEVPPYYLHKCDYGKWKLRIIIPVLDIDGKILGWQGRAIVNPKTAPRYLTSHPQVKRTIFNLPSLKAGGKVLYITEGPMDAMKIDYFGQPDIRATCTFGAVFSPEQVEMLYKLSSKFLKLVLLFDFDHAGITNGFSLSDWLPMASFGALPEGHKDTDHMKPNQMKEWLNDNANLW